MDPFVLHNGVIEPLAETRLDPGQAGLLAGWGVFTTLRIYSGKPFEFPRHYDRMAHDALRLGVDLSAYPVAELERRIVELARVNPRPEGMGRVWFVRNQGGLWADSTGRPATDLLVFTRALVPWPAAHRLLVQDRAVYSAGILAGAKMLSWAQNNILLERAHQHGYDDALLLNERGEIAECTSANFFLVRGGRVLTPPLESGCLPGVTRDVIFAVAAKAGIEIVPETLTPADFASADEVFISSTTREVAAVGYISPNWTFPAPGPLTRRLEDGFKAYVADHL